VTILELLEARATRFDAKSAYRFVDTGADWSYAELARRAARAGGQLSGVEPGARVGILTEDRAVFCDSFFGAHARGVTPVPLGAGGVPGSAAWGQVLADRVKRFGLVAVATDPGLADDVRTALGAAALVVTLDGGSGNLAPVSPGAPHAFVQPSSGTTGDPKGIVVSENALFSNLQAIREQWDLTEDDIGLSWLPLHHDMGLIGTVLNAVYQGAMLYHWPTQSFLRSPGRYLQLIGELGVTIAVGPPFALTLVTRRQQRRPATFDLSSVRSMLVGAEMIRPEVLDAFTEEFAGFGLAPSALCPTYGLAEATLAVTANRRTDAYRVVELGGRRFTSCGSPVPGVQVRLGPDDELLVASPALMDGYLDDPSATGATVVDGWLRTGDTAAIVDGDVVVTGRSKEMINRGGVRVPATEFELALAGVDGLLADRIVAFADTVDDLPDGASERVVVLAESRWTDRAGEAVLAARARLSEVGLPVDVVELVKPGFIPRTTSGKLRRAAAREKWRAGRRTLTD
jgi:fatty-acyl-CoA synthase